MKPVHWSVKELAVMTKNRISNKFDANIAVTGATGLGKSTFLYKFFNKFDDFNIDDKFTMNRSRMIDLIKNYRYSYCWNDELIKAGFKRNFYEQEQQQLITDLTTYRDNFNITAGALPFFFTLDKELVKLFGMHINIISRGIGVVHLPRPARMYSEDIWDTKINQKLEESWSKKILKNPDFRIPYHKYTTFAGYVFFGAMTEKQEAHYLELKAKERKSGDPSFLAPEEKSFNEKMYDMLIAGKLTEEKLLTLCLYEGKKLSSVKVTLARMLKDAGEDTLGNFMKKDKNDMESINLNNNDTIKKLKLIGG